MPNPIVTEFVTLDGVMRREANIWAVSSHQLADAGWRDADAGPLRMTRQQLNLRIGTMCLILSSIALVYVPAVAHGDLPTGTGEAALTFVAARHGYPLVHFCGWLGVLAWSLGLVALAGALTHRAAWARGR